MSVKKNEIAKIDLWVQRYVIKLKNMMGLQHWTINMSAKPCGDDCLAETEVVYGQHLATMQLNKNFRKWSPEETRGTIVHELLHCHLAPLSEIVGEILKPDEGDQKATAILKSVNAVIEYETERIIDSLSESICKWLPSPDMPKPKVKKNSVVKKKPLKRK